MRIPRSFERALPSILVAGVMLAVCSSAAAQVSPRPPSLPTTTTVNPRGADVVEPMDVYRVTVRRGGEVDSVLLGVAKIPDPRRGEDGAYARTDLATGTLVRMSDAWIVGDDGLRRLVDFDPSAASDRLVFVAGPHDEVVSRQGVEALARVPGDRTIFELADLYDSAHANPLRPGQSAQDGRTARTALLTMRSTYRGGEAVNLVVQLAPREVPIAIQPIQIVRRDTTIFVTPSRMYVMPPPTIRPVRVVTLVASVETGYGPRHVRTFVPATTVSPFDSRGRADAYYVEGWVQFERPTHRWRAHVFGMSSLAESEVTQISHHQVALHADLRFEYGRSWFTAVQAKGRLADKAHQEFSWTSADYSGTLMLGRGWRHDDYRGLERQRYELLAGIRMGENRIIDVYRAGDRARGLGGEIALRGRRADLALFGAEVHLSAEAVGYTIAGRGARDAGFRERGVRIGADARIGQEIGGMFVFAAVRGMLRREKAWFPGGSEYFMYDYVAAPAIGVEMRF